MDVSFFGSSSEEDLDEVSEEEEEDMGEEEEENVGEDDQSEAQVHFRPFSVPFINLLLAWAFVRFVVWNMIANLALSFCPLRLILKVIVQ